jgi:hypothetical protein
MTRMAMSYGKWTTKGAQHLQTFMNFLNGDARNF